jgi:hypothetical protein
MHAVNGYRIRSHAACFPPTTCRETLEASGKQAREQPSVDASFVSDAYNALNASVLQTLDGVFDEHSQTIDEVGDAVCLSL